MSPKKRSPLAWILIGCVGILLLGALLMGTCTFLIGKKVKDVTESGNPAMAAAKMIVALNPEVELVSEDEDEGTLTIRNKETGEEATFDLDEIQEGRFSFKTGDREVTFDPDNEDGILRVEDPDGETVATFGGGNLDNLPDWVPLYPGAETESPVLFTQNGVVSGGVASATNASLSEVAEFYAGKLDDLGLEVQSTSTSGPDGASQILSGTGEDDMRVNVVAVEDGDLVRVTVNFSGPA